MFELHHLKGNTYYFDAYANVGVIKKENSKVILIDSCDHIRMVADLDRILVSENLKVETILCTHAHVDHIAGNKYFSEKYGCKILCTPMEECFMKFTHMEPDIYYNGTVVDKIKNPYYQAQPSVPELITEENLPEGLELIPLPGHSFEMVGVRTEDNVVFLADSIMSKATWENHRLPYFNDINKSIETLEMIKTLEGDIFLPSHSEPESDIKDLCDYNIAKMKERKEVILSFCDGKNSDEIFSDLMKFLGLEIKSNRYQMYYLMMKHYLQSLIDDGKITGIFDGKSYIYKHV